MAACGLTCVGSEKSNVESEAENVACWRSCFASENVDLLGVGCSNNTLVSDDVRVH